MQRIWNLTSRACRGRDTAIRPPRRNGSQRHRQGRRRASKLRRASDQYVIPHPSFPMPKEQHTSYVMELAAKQDWKASGKQLLTEPFCRSDPTRNVRRPRAPSLPRQLRPSTHTPQQMPARRVVLTLEVCGESTSLQIPNCP